MTKRAKRALRSSRRRSSRRKTTQKKTVLSPKSAEAQRRAFRALGLMRQGLSRQQAAARAKTSPRTIQKYSRPAIRRRAGHYKALPSDQMPRLMRVLTEQGVTVVEIRGSQLASRLSQYWHAVDEYLRTGDRRLLRRYEGKRFRAGGRLWVFITDPELLSRLGEVGEVRFEDLYETTA